MCLYFSSYTKINPYQSIVFKCKRINPQICNVIVEKVFFRVTQHFSKHIKKTNSVNIKIYNLCRVEINKDKWETGEVFAAHRGSHLFNIYKLSSNQYEKAQKFNKNMGLLTEKERLISFKCMKKYSFTQEN